MFRPLSVEERLQTPDGESADAVNGQLPRTHPDVCHRPVASKLGPTVSRTFRVTD